MVVDMRHFQSKPEGILSEQLQKMENKEALPTSLSWCFLLLSRVTQPQHFQHPHPYVQSLGVPWDSLS